MDNLNYRLRIELLSDTTFSRGDGVAGLVDQEIEHDPRTGLPFIGARRLKGLLVEEASNLLYALECSESPHLSTFQEAAQFLFGRGSSTHDDESFLRLSNATLPDDLVQTITYQINKTNTDKLTPQEVLSSLTSIRRQTAVGDDGVPQDNTLRSMRVLLRGLTLTAGVRFTTKTADQDAAEAMLAVCARCVRRGGTGRNRGRGRLSVVLTDREGRELKHALDYFEAVVAGAKS